MSKVSVKVWRSGLLRGGVETLVYLGAHASVLNNRVLIVQSAVSGPPWTVGFPLESVASWKVETV